MLTGTDLFMLHWLKDQSRAIENWLNENPAAATRRRLEQHRVWLTAEFHRLESRAA